MKRFYWIAGAVLVAVGLVVLFVPGASVYVESRLLSWLAGAAS